MNSLLPTMFLATAALADGHPRSYLVSLVDLPLNAGESVEAFSISTWGVEFRSICKIPGGWRLKAGNSASPDGILEGEGSQGATWFNRRSPKELRQFALVTLYGDVQLKDVTNGPDATFKGTATISSANGERTAPISGKNVALSPADSCR